jgi:hypothetical protein
MEIDKNRQTPNSEEIHEENKNEVGILKGDITGEGF